MSGPVQFLTGLSKAASAMTLYKEAHPARERAIAQCHERLKELLKSDGSLEFTFLGDQIVCGGRPLPGLKSWSWNERLVSVGIQRLEILPAVTRDELEGFLEEVLARLADEKGAGLEAARTGSKNIRYGQATLKGESGDRLGAALEEGTATLGFDLQEEAAVAGWIQEEVRSGNHLPIREAETIVRSLSVAMHAHQQYLVPLLRLRQLDQYATAHALNVSTLSMALGEFVGLGSRAVRSLGVSGLLHDVGSVRIPAEILAKPGELTENEREIVNTHPAEGARILLETEEELDLATAVAYEHHVRPDGEGYPSFTHPRRCHPASEIVHVCAVFDALLNDRPYRKAWDQPRALEYIEEGAGSEFHAELAGAFVEMMRTWGDRLATIRDVDEELPLSEPSRDTVEATS